VADPSEPQLLQVKEFVDRIDSQSGYFYRVAKTTDDFEEELESEALRRDDEKKGLQLRLSKVEERLSVEHTQFVQQLVSALALPLDDKEVYRKEDEMIKSFGWSVSNNGRVYHRGVDSQHRLFVPKNERTYMMTAAHDHSGHRGFFSTKALLTQRFWWPEMERDINQFVETCHPCQERQKQLVRIPPTKTHTPSIFEILQTDIMHMSPASNGCKYIVHGHNNLMSWAEGRGLRDEKAQSIAQWLYEDILCRWGSIRVIVTDNGECC